MERAILVTIDSNPFSLKELKNLAEALDIECVFSIIQNLDAPLGEFYIGKGKVDEVKTAINVYDANLVIFDDELKPSQIRNLEEKLETVIMDRSYLILEIFARHARTKQAMLEIDLAKLKYMLPRLVGMDNSLSRQGGGNYAKGSGEKKIELDRRKIENQIIRIEKELNTINGQMKTRNKKREKEGIKIAALVGYTNSGKSATMNSLLKVSSNSENLVLEKDGLFATLDTYVRKIKTNLNQEFLLVDTIGFVSKLPHNLINSFKSTLDEALNADLLIHVVDANNPEYENQIKITNEVISSLEAGDTEMIYAFSKADKMEEQFFPTYPNAILYSNKTKQNLDLLLNKIEEKLFNITEIDLLIPYKDSKDLAYLETHAKITKKQFLDEGTLINLFIDNKLLKDYQKYIK